jgi:hypothetical protein
MEEVLEKVFLIKRTFVSEGLVETDVDVYATEEKRDEAWNALVLSHNNMMIDCHEMDLNHINEDEWFYEWGDKELTCYDAQDPTAEAYYFAKDWNFIQGGDK